MTTFDEVFGNVTPSEREALVWYLAALRARATVEALLKPQDAPNEFMTIPPEGWKPSASDMDRLAVRAE